MKPRKPPARKSGEIPYGVKIQILNWLLKGRPDIAKDPKALKNELRILKGLLLTYPSPSFWLSLRIPLDLNSLCFFLSQSGKQELEKKWRLHWFEKNQGKAQNPLDSVATFPMMAEEISFVDEPAKTRELPPELSRRKTSALDWADSASL